MPGLVAKAVLWSRLVKFIANRIKSYQIPVAQGRRRKSDKDLWMIMLPIDLPSYTGHRRAIHTRLPACRSAQMKDVT